MITTFGEYLRELREGKGWTRVQASMNINEICRKRETIVSVDSLDKWERDKVVPRIEPIKAMAIVYNRPDLIQRRLDAIELSRHKKDRLYGHTDGLSAKQIQLA